MLVEELERLLFGTTVLDQLLEARQAIALISVRRVAGLLDQMAGMLLGQI
jgi:hypothetical protein